MTAQTGAQERLEQLRAAAQARQNRHVAHRKAEGLKQVRLWCHPDDEAALRELAAKLQRKRAKEPK